jgi:alcohol dehydrogenase
LREYGEPLAIDERPVPDPSPDGAVVAVEACGICRSDWHAWQGHGEWADDQVPTGHVLGHEPAGRVVAVGDRVDRVAVGDRVVVPFDLGCGACSACHNGRGNVCPDGLGLGFSAAAPGAFAERVAVPHADYNVVSLPDGVAFTDAAALGCRFATAYQGLVNRATLRAGEWLAVYGCGGVGLSAVALGAALGARPIAVDVRSAPLAAAAELGAAETVDASEIANRPRDGDRRQGPKPGPASGDPPGQPDVVDVVRGAADGGVDVSVDALGRRETARNAVASLRPRGRHVQIGLTTDAERGAVSLPTDAMTRWEVDWYGARGLAPSQYDGLVSLVASGAVDPGALVTREVSLDAVPDRLAAMSEYDTVGVEVVTSF